MSECVSVSASVSVSVSMSASVSVVCNPENKRAREQVSKQARGSEGMPGSKCRSDGQSD